MVRDKMSRDSVSGARCSPVFEEIKFRPCGWNDGGGTDISVSPGIESAESRYC